MSTLSTGGAVLKMNTKIVKISSLVFFLHFFEQLSIGILEQSHLCPLPLSIQPILWDFDHSLRIWPTPDLV